MRICKTPLIVSLLACCVATAAVANEEERRAKQAEMDAACEAAREARLKVDRAKYVEECVAKEQREDRAACERFYADYGARVGNRPALYYDLPACVAAHEFRLGHEGDD